MTTFVWQLELHATYCPQHNPPPEDGGGSSWLCDCSGPLLELRAAARAVIDAEYGSNMWVEAFDVLVDVVLEQERLEALAEREELTVGEQAPASPTPSRSASARSDFARFYDAVDKAQEIDNTGGDSAVSVVLWSWAETRARQRLAAEDRAAEVRLRGEEHVARLEAEATRG